MRGYFIVFIIYHKSLKTSILFSYFLGEFL